LSDLGKKKQNYMTRIENIGTMSIKLLFIDSINY